MAGGELKRDPAIERWAAMREQTHYYFRLNRSKLLPLAILLGVIPAAIAYGSIKCFVSLIAAPIRRLLSMLGFQRGIQERIQGRHDLAQITDEFYASLNKDGALFMLHELMRISGIQRAVLRPHGPADKQSPSRR
jgi:hypothetical protein